MKKTLERLDSTKFNALTNASKAAILGGIKTGGGCEVVKFERANGMDRDYVREWGSDENDGKDICFYTVTYRWTEWY